jgi:hypothetical protein
MLVADLDSRSLEMDIRPAITFKGASAFEAIIAMNGSLSEAGDGAEDQGRSQLQPEEGLSAASCSR